VAGAVAWAGCTQTPPKPVGGVELIIVADGLSAPTDFDDIHLEVSQQSGGANWNKLWGNDYEVPSPAATLPATFAIIAGQSPDQEVLIEVTAFKVGEPVVQRVAQVQVPTDRVAALWMVLAEVCRGQVAVVGAEGGVVSTCPSGQSCQPSTGGCGSNVVSEPAALPTYVPGESLDAAPEAMVVAVSAETGPPAAVSAADSGRDAAEAGSSGSSSGSGGSGDSGRDAAEAGPSGSSSSGGPACTNSCTSGTQCSSSGVQTCERQANGCMQWVATATCGPHQACASTAGAAACQCDATVCTQAGTVCQGAQTVATCATDADSCLYAASTASCAAPSACAGASPTAACSAPCGATSACGTALVCERYAGPVCADPNWAEWPLPNAQVDVAAGAPNLESYTDNGDGTVTDNVTGLQWQQAAPATTYTQAAALAYCTGLSLGGHTDWRLPSYVELFSIVDFGAYNPSINGTVFPGTPADYFWSSTPYAGASGGAWVVFFNFGYAYGFVVSGTGSARCVR
jgi:hypothetical protein